MAYGVAPYVGSYDPYASRAYQRALPMLPLGELDPLRGLVDESAGPPDTTMTRPSLTPSWAPARKEPSIWKQGLMGALSPEGQAAIAAGIQAGQRTPGGSFGESFLSGLGASLGTGQQLRYQREEMDRQRQLEERRAGAMEVAARRQTADRETTGEKLQATYDFLKKAGYTDDEIKRYFNTHGAHGGAAGGTGRLTDLDKMANALFAQKRAKSLDEAYIMARTIAQQPQAVGSVVRIQADPEDPYSSTVRRVTVYRRLDPLTGDYETIDAQGNVLTADDMKTFQAGMNGAYPAGTGGPANTGRAPEEPPYGPGTAVAPPGGDWMRYTTPVQGGAGGIIPAPPVPFPMAASHGATAAPAGPQPWQGVNPEVARVRASTNIGDLTALLSQPNTPLELRNAAVLRLAELGQSRE